MYFLCELRFFTAYSESAILKGLSAIYFVRRFDKTTLPPPLPRTSTTRFGIFCLRNCLNDDLKKPRNLLFFVNVFTSMNAVCKSSSMRMFLCDKSISFLVSFFEGCGGRRVGNVESRTGV